jgi:hypothetical protein
MSNLERIISVDEHEHFHVQQIKSSIKDVLVHIFNLSRPPPLSLKALGFMLLMLWLLWLEVGQESALFSTSLYKN